MHWKKKILKDLRAWLKHLAILLSSLQNVYSVKNLSRQEMAVGLAFSDVILKGRGVSRVHGGGFAGTIQAFVPNDIVDIYKKNMEDIFGQDACHVLKIRKYGGMKVL